MTGAWRERAACAGTDPEQFFPAFPSRGTAAAARELCASCPAVRSCLEYALADESIVGIWGGTNERERQVMRLRAGSAPRTFPDVA